MTSVTLAAAFNVLVSGAFSFAFAAALTWMGARLLRIRDGRLGLALVLLPFAKLAFEIARGVPDNAFFWLKVREGAQQELGGFRIGFGLDRFSPIVDAELSAKWHGAQHPQSAADVLASGLTRHVGPGTPGIVALVLLAGGMVGVVWFVVRFARGAPRGWRDGAEVLERRAVGLRSAAIMASASWDGVPFATGILRPVVCLPARLIAQLSAEEREAVIQHELAHLRGLHAVIVFVVGAFAKMFWFVPGTGLLAREACAQCEVCADDAAVRAGVDRTLLASALVRVAELATATTHAPPLALFGRAPVLTRRVARLLAAPARRRWFLLGLRGLGVVTLAATVLRATTLGNP